MKYRHILACAGATLLGHHAAFAQSVDKPIDTAKNHPPAAADASPPAEGKPDWTSTISYALQFEGSIAVNPADPAGNLNFGHELADRANRPLFNQALATISRPVSGGPDTDVGFNLQGLFGTDARYTPTIGLFDQTFKGRYQFVLTQANVVVHTPILTEGGVDFKIGLAPGAMGYEGIDPTSRPFYTLSYVTNFMVPFQTVGVIATIHASPKVDIITGIDAGNEVVPGKSDNNGAPAGYFGVSLNHLANDRLTILAMTRFGPENSLKVMPDANRRMRYWNDVTATYKLSDRTTLVGEANYIRDDGLKAEAFGVVGYVIRTLSPEWSLAVRGEVMRDSQGAFVVGFASDTAFANGIIGNPDNFVTAPPTTYGGLTIGASYKPAAINSKKVAVTIRPELRYDRSLNGTRPYNGLSDKDQVIGSLDLIVGF